MKIIQMVSPKTYLLAQTSYCTKPTNVNNPNGKSKNVHFSTSSILYKTN
jgi:hypothetical protein